MDIELMRTQLAGLEANGKDLDIKKATFLKIQGLREQMAKERVKVAGIEKDIVRLKKNLETKKDLKQEAVSDTLQAICDRMNAILPEGTAVVNLDAGTISLGWKVGDTIEPYGGLSGGELVAFNGALANALDAGIILMEAAEADPSRLDDLLGHIGGIDKQVIINTWLIPGTKPSDKWNVVKL